MKRSGWMTCVLVGGLAGVVAASWSRPTREGQSPDLGRATADSATECNSASGEACSCGTGTNRAALMRQAPQGQPRLETSERQTPRPQN